jgi:phosphohistidine phosphatase SixA
MQNEARGMAALGIGADVILTSPLVRCRQTAAIVAAAIGGTPRDEPRLRPGSHLDLVADVLLEHPDAGSVMICGHQPDLSELIAALTGGGEVQFRKGSLAILDVESPRPAGGRLQALYPPGILMALGAA